MKFYNQLTIIGNRKNYNTLARFRSLVTEYFQNIEPDGMGGAPHENETAQSARQGINTLMMSAYSATFTAGIQPGVTYTSAPIAGARTSHVDVITNIFNLHVYDMGVQEVLDFVDRSCGVYEADRIAAWIRTFNPFYWFMRGTDFLVKIPFRLFGKIGMNQKKIEASLVGRIVKGLLYLITVLSSFLTILGLLGLIEPFKTALKRLF